jgi:plasmid stabilization system protein ParE
MTLHVSSEADIDYIEAVSYYVSEESARLADRFTTELEKAYASILEAPHRNRMTVFGLREKRVKGFPFSVLYSVEGEELYVHAIYHDDRKRSKLTKRL